MRKQLSLKRLRGWRVRERGGGGASLQGRRRREGEGRRREGTKGGGDRRCGLLELSLKGPKGGDVFFFLLGESIFRWVGLRVFQRTEEFGTQRNHEIWEERKNTRREKEEKPNDSWKGVLSRLLRYLESECRAGGRRPSERSNGTLFHREGSSRTKKLDAVVASAASKPAFQVSKPSLMNNKET